jgi:hypothetical protein
MTEEDIQHCRSQAGMGKYNMFSYLHRVMKRETSQLCVCCCSKHRATSTRLADGLHGWHRQAFGSMPPAAVAASVQA